MERREITLLSRGSLPDWLGKPEFSGDGSGDGYGYGYGAGYGAGDGYGYGYGAGDGSGDGAGDGSGSGYGYGYGAGYGSGDGYGYGYGAGSGSGYGSGYGSGSGDGEKEYISIGQTIVADNPRPTAEVVAFWRSNASGLPANGGRSSTPAAPGVIEEIPGPLSICSRGLHATLKPNDWQGERLWVVALYGEVQWSGDKCAALKREILGEVT